MTWKKLLLIGLVALCGWFIYTRFSSENYVNFPPTAQGPWVAFGDSLTEGMGASEGNGYPAVLSQALGVPIQNLGRSGETSKDALNRLEEVASLKPRVVLLCFGGNDGLNGLPATQLFQNMETLIDRFHREGSFVVLIGIRSASLRDRFDKSFRRLAKEKQVLYVPDFLKGLVFKPVYMSDAIHPNDEGYKRFAARLEAELKPLMDQLKPGGKELAGAAQ